MVPLYTKVSSIQGVGIEGIHCTQWCPHFQGVGIEEFHCIQWCPHFWVLEWRGSTVHRSVLNSGCLNRGVPLYTGVSSFQGVGNRRNPLYTMVSSFQGVGIEEYHCIQWCPHFWVLEWRGSTVYRGVLI